MSEPSLYAEMLRRQTDQSPTLDDLTTARDDLRGWEEDNFWTSLGLGFVPGVGSVYGGLSGAAALSDPDASGLEKGLAAAGFTPMGHIARMLKQAPDQLGITVFHGGPEFEGPPRPMHEGGEGNWTEGPGLYLTPAYSEASSYAESTPFYDGANPSKRPLVYRYDLDDEAREQMFLINPAGLGAGPRRQFDLQYEQVKDILADMFPGMSDEQRYQQFVDDFMWHSGSAPDFQTRDAQRMYALAEGIRGTETPGLAYIVSFDPAEDLTELDRLLPSGWGPDEEMMRLSDAYKRQLIGPDDLSPEVLRAVEMASSRGGFRPLDEMIGSGNTQTVEDFIRGTAQNVHPDALEFETRRLGLSPFMQDDIARRRSSYSPLDELETDNYIEPEQISVGQFEDLGALSGDDFVRTVSNPNVPGTHAVPMQTDTADFLAEKLPGIFDVDYDEIGDQSLLVVRPDVYYGDATDELFDAFNKYKGKHWFSEQLLDDLVDRLVLQDSDDKERIVSRLRENYDILRGKNK